MSHLTTDELVDAVEQTLSPARQAHLIECGDCRHHVAQMAALVHEVRLVDVPEPSPLFWDRFSDRVRRAIADEGRVPPRLARWFEWPVLVPVGALAALVLALTSAISPRVVGTLDNATAINVIEPAPMIEPAGDVDAQWELVAAIVGEVDVEAAEQAGIRTTPGAADEAVLQLTAAEQQELLRLLREELERSGG